MLLAVRLEANECARRVMTAMLEELPNKQAQSLVKAWNAFQNNADKPRNEQFCEHSNFASNFPSGRDAKKIAARAKETAGTRVSPQLLTAEGRLGRI